jgi:hypothetical protein
VTHVELVVHVPSEDHKRPVGGGSL